MKDIIVDLISYHRSSKYFESLGIPKGQQYETAVEPRNVDTFGTRIVSRLERCSDFRGKIIQVRIVLGPNEVSSTRERCPA